jgi:hypothetical protein
VRQSKEPSTFWDLAADAHRRDVALHVAVVGPVEVLGAVREVEQQIGLGLDPVEAREADHVLVTVELLHGVVECDRRPRVVQADRVALGEAVLDRRRQHVGGALAPPHQLGAGGALVRAKSSFSLNLRPPGKSSRRLPRTK